MNSYVDIQMALVAARQSALRTEAADARLLASASPLPAVSAGSRAAGFHGQAADADRHGADERVAVRRSLGAAATSAGTMEDRASAPEVGRTGKPCECGETAAAA